MQAGSSMSEPTKKISGYWFSSRRPKPAHRNINKPDVSPTASAHIHEYDDDSAQWSAESLH